MKVVHLLLLASALAPAQPRRHVRRAAPAPPTPPALATEAPALIAPPPVPRLTLLPPAAPELEAAPPPARPKLNTDQILFDAEAAARFLQKAIEEHTYREPNFRPHRQFPEDKLPPTPTLLHRDGSLTPDWTPEQHARFLMEQLRQGIHAVQGAERSWTIDILALESARAAWPGVRDLFCSVHPNVVYYDSDGFKHYCPAQ